MATVAAIVLLTTVSAPMALGLGVVASILVVAMFRLAAAGRPLHHDFADKAAVIDGEMVDVISNMPVVRAFGGIGREHSRFDITLDHEMGARQRSLRYLEKLRLFHAIVTIMLTGLAVAPAVSVAPTGKAMRTSVLNVPGAELDQVADSGAVVSAVVL